MNIRRLHPIVENVLFHLGVAREIRVGREPHQENTNAAAREISVEIVHERRYHDQQLLKAIEKAQSPDSPGGRNITPTEAGPIATIAKESLIELSSDAGQLAKHDAA